MLRERLIEILLGLPEGTEIYVRQRDDAWPANVTYWGDAVLYFEAVPGDHRNFPEGHRGAKQVALPAWGMPDADRAFLVDNLQEVSERHVALYDSLPHLRLLPPLKEANLVPQALDMTNQGLTDEDLIRVAKQFQPNLRWVSFAGNSCVRRKGVEAICLAVKEGRWPNLEWLDLTATKCDATPYLDGHGQTRYWRMPKITHELAEQFGYQRWMGFGPRNQENKVLVDTAASPPSRDDYPPIEAHLVGMR